jgi:hypothetical protein
MRNKFSFVYIAALVFSAAAPLFADTATAEEIARPPAARQEKMKPETAKPQAAKPKEKDNSTKDS